MYFETGLARTLQVANIPTTIILDKEGRVARRMNGFLPDRFVDQLTEHINDILAGPDGQAAEAEAAKTAPAPTRPAPVPVQLLPGQSLGGRME